MRDRVEDSSAFWDGYAQLDPLWAILSYTSKSDGRWDVTQFFLTGTREIWSVIDELDVQDVLPPRGSALDFGCGVGRLTQALALHFDRVVGVDVSARMLDLATRLNRYPQSVSYVHNQAEDLSIFADQSFDFVVSSMVLQHIRPAIAKSYLREFLRVLTPEGIAVFQLPSHHRRLANRGRGAFAKPMVDDAYRASLQVSGVPRRVRPAGQVTLQVEVTNLSMFDWIRRDHSVFAIGDHWLDGAGSRMLTRDDGRTPLPAILRAGGTCRLSLTINAPSTCGEYQCEVDVAHEGVLWFQDRGSKGARFAVLVSDDVTDTALEADASQVAPPMQLGVVSADPSVEADGVAGATQGVDDPGEFLMFGIPVNVVVRLIADCGATLIHIENDRSGGDDWVSYRYFVRAPGSR